MCRSIKVLRTEEIAAEAEVRAAALQYVRKISGLHHPNKSQAEAFEAAIEDIVGASVDLLATLGPKATRAAARA